MYVALEWNENGCGLGVECKCMWPWSGMRMCVALEWNENACGLRVECKCMWH